MSSFTKLVLGFVMMLAVGMYYSLYYNLRGMSLLMYYLSCAKRVLNSLPVIEPALAIPASALAGGAALRILPIGDSITCKTPHSKVC